MRIALTLILLAVALWINGNILIFATPPIQVCIGWPDDMVYSWWCTPDYTVEEAYTEWAEAQAEAAGY